MHSETFRAAYLIYDRENPFPFTFLFGSLRLSPEDVSQ